MKKYWSVIFLILLAILIWFFFRYDMPALSGCLASGMTVCAALQIITISKKGEHLTLRQLAPKNTLLIGGFLGLLVVIATNLYWPRYGNFYSYFINSFLMIIGWFACLLGVVVAFLTIRGEH
jgi:hypothetical protein